MVCPRTVYIALPELVIKYGQAFIHLTKEKRKITAGLVLIDRTTLKVTPVNLNEININSSKIVCSYFDGSNMWIGTDKGLCKILIENPLAKWTLKKEEAPKTEQTIFDELILISLRSSGVTLKVVLSISTKPRP